MLKQIKKGMVSFEGAKPMTLTAFDGVTDLESLTAEQKAILESVGSTMSAYLKATKELLTGKLSGIVGWVPPHLSGPGNVLVACCSEGVVIRYELKSNDEPKIYSGWMSGTLTEVAATVSQNIIQCHPTADYQSTISTTGAEITISKTSADANGSTTLATLRLGLDIVLPGPEQEPASQLRPFCLVSARSTLEIHLLGQILPAESGDRIRQPFLIRSAMRLAVGWDCIEVFPYMDLSKWDPEFAPAWAENDILASVMSHQIREAQFEALDPYVEARKHLAALLEDYKALLDSDPEREESLQVFLAANPALLCPTHTKMWPKLPLGAHITDFVFREAAGDYLLVELERSVLPLFKKDGHTTQYLNNARGQVQDWKRYIEDNRATVERELGLSDISTNPPCMIVIGRSASLSVENRRKLTTLENEAPRLKIMTYDDIYERAKAVIENLFGPLWNVEGNTQIYYLPG